jgi:hypothetical protein
MRVYLCGALSLTRGQVCRLQFLLALASAVIFGSESRGTRDHILLFQILYFPFRRLLRLAGSRWRYSTPPPHWSTLESITCHFFITWSELNRDHHPEQIIHYCMFIVTDTCFNFVASRCLEMDYSASIRCRENMC